MKYINFNGELKNAESPYMFSNRASRYGDGVFETIRVINGTPLFISSHYKRLIAGIRALKITPPEFFSEEFFNLKIAELTKSNNITKGGKIRLSVFRSGTGAYLPEENTASFIIEAQTLSSDLYTLNKEGLIIDVFKELNKTVNKYSKFKTLNGLLYVLASVYAKENEMDDCLITNESGNIIESTSSNIFIVSNGVLYTPPIEDGCVGGVMRMNVINTAVSNKIKVYESSLTPQSLLIADEIFLTNTIKGLEWVRGYKNKRYYNKITRDIIYLINKKITSYEKDFQENLK